MIKSHVLYRLSYGLAQLRRTIGTRGRTGQPAGFRAPLGRAGFTP